MKRSFKKMIAVLCAIAMVVTSVTVYNTQTAVASANATANGIFVNYSQFKDFADGEYPILVTATTSGETAKDVKGNATLKIQDQGETEPAVTDPSAVKRDDISWLGNETTDQGNLDKFKAYVSPANPKKLEVINIQTKNDVNALYMPNNDSPADKIEVNGADVTSDCITDGAQTFVPVSLLTKMYNSVVITTVNSNELSAFIFDKAGEGGNTPVDPETTPGNVGRTPDAVETTTPDAAETTTPSVVETTTQASATTEAPKTTTAAPKVTTKKALGKTTVKSASKKKAATKVKLTFKKVKGAKKYQVQISKTKKFKKVLVKKTVRKVSVTIKSKKVKNQKKLYVRIRAVGAKKWSKAKKIKIKK